MPTELEELVEFLHHGNTQIRQVATHNLVPYSEKEPAIFKTTQLTPVKDLKLLVKDYTPIAHDALTILVNISGDAEVLKALNDDDVFLESILLRLTNPKEPNANLFAMLLANMSKDERIKRLATVKRDAPASLCKSKLALDQLMDVFVRGAGGAYNKDADYDYLAYVFADLAKFSEGSAYLTTEQSYDGLHPLSKLLPFLSHSSLPRRLGASSALKNVCFTMKAHPTLLAPPLAVLPFVLLPLASGADAYAAAESDDLPDELQLLDDGVKRERDNVVLRAHLDTLLLLTSSRKGRDHLRDNGTYYVIRECHLAVEDEDVREACERLVNVLMRDEEGEEKKGPITLAPTSAQHAGGGGGIMVTNEQSDDEDDQVTEIKL